MSIADTLKGLIFNNPANSAEPRDPRRSKEPRARGPRAGEARNPKQGAPPPRYVDGGGGVAAPP
ncbi:hypothetical protein, partial [Achromobacter insolitus]